MGIVVEKDSRPPVLIPPFRPAFRSICNTGFESYTCFNRVRAIVSWDIFSFHARRRLERSQRREQQATARPALPEHPLRSSPQSPAVRDPPSAARSPPRRPAATRRYRRTSPPQRRVQSPILRWEWGMRACPAPFGSSRERTGRDTGTETRQRWRVAIRVGGLGVRKLLDAAAPGFPLLKRCGGACVGASVRIGASGEVYRLTPGG